jgi:hypothetical protein
LDSNKKFLYYSIHALGDSPPGRRFRRFAKMARKTKAQIRAAVAAQLNGAESVGPAQPQAGDAAAAAFFASRVIIAQPTNEADAEENEAPAEDNEFDAQQKAADALADKLAAAMLAADAAAPAKGAKKPYIKNSSIARPTKKAWAIADAMVKHAEENDLPVPTRGEIITECIKQGIASGTSATQYQYWKKANGR